MVEYGEWIIRNDTVTIFFISNPSNLEIKQSYDTNRHS